jgi:hypothetical protein
MAPSRRQPRVGNERQRLDNEELVSEASWSASAKGQRRPSSAGKSVELVDTLMAQNRAGRVLTDAILHRANARALKDPGERAKLMASLRLFARMYRPHAAREDTVLYPQLRSVVSRHEFDALGDEFENNERKLFGEEGFEGVVGRVAGLEKKLGVYDLASFTASWTQS